MSYRNSRTTTIMTFERVLPASVAARIEAAVKQVNPDAYCIRGESRVGHAAHVSVDGYIGYEESQRLFEAASVAAAAGGR